MKQLNANYNHEKTYSDFRRSISGIYCQDIDFIEYGFKDGELNISAVMETTHIHTMKPHVFDMVYERIMEKTPQGKILLTAAHRFQCKAFIVGYDNPIGDFAVCDITGDQEWIVMDEKEYESFLRELRG